VTTPTLVDYGTAAAGANFSVTTVLGAETNDIFVAMRHNDFYNLDNYQEPTCADIPSWASGYGTISAVNGMSTQVYMGSVFNPDASTITVNLSTVAGDGSYVSWALVRYAVWIDGAGGGASSSNNTASTSHVLPSVDPDTADALLLCSAIAGSNGVVDYSVGASGLTKLAEVDNAPFSTVAMFRQTLASAAATGTKTVTSSASRRFSGVSLAFAGNGGTPPAAVSTNPRFMSFF
jgi:hypothetical protein